MVGATFLTSPGTSRERNRILRDAIAAAYRDPEFFKDFKKVTGEASSRIMPEEFDVIIKKLPRNPEDVELFEKIARGGPLPGH